MASNPKVSTSIDKALKEAEDKEPSQIKEKTRGGGSSHQVKMPKLDNHLYNVINVPLHEKLIPRGNVCK